MSRNNNRENGDNPTGNYEQQPILLGNSEPPNGDSRQDDTQNGTEQVSHSAWRHTGGKWIKGFSKHQNFLTAVLLIFTVYQSCDQGRQIEAIRKTIQTGIETADGALRSALSEQNAATQGILTQNKNALDSLKTQGENTLAASNQSFEKTLVELKRQATAQTAAATAAEAQSTAIVESNRINQGSLDQAKTALAATTAASQMELRPYLVVTADGRHFQGNVTPFSQVSFRVDFINAGRSLAKRAQMFFRAGTAEGIVLAPGGPVNPYAGGPDKVFDAARATIVAPEDFAPGGTVNTTSIEPATLFINPDIYSRFQSGNLVFVFAGGITYRDTFSTVPHTTEFCYYVDRTYAATRVFISCAFHNQIQ